MSAKSKGDESGADEQLEDLMVQHESLQERLNVAHLENQEYQKEIDHLKRRNSQLSVDVVEHKQLLTLEKKRASISVLQLSAFDSTHSDNQDLTNQVKEYKRLNQQLNSENLQLKNENEKYKETLANHNKQKQKREEIYNNEKLKLQEINKELHQQIDELEQENKALHDDISAMFLHSKQLTSPPKSLTGGSFQDLKGPAFHVKTIHELSPQTSVEPLLPTDVTTTPRRHEQHRSFINSVDMGLHQQIALLSSTNSLHHDGEEIGLETDEDDGKINSTRSTKHVRFMSSMYGRELQAFVEQQNELDLLRKQLMEATSQVKEFKQKIVAQDQVIKKLKRDGKGKKNGRYNKLKNEQREMEESQCKIFGWTAW